MLELLGIIFCVIAITRILYAVPGIFTRPRSNKETWETTVLLTGATDGIGKALAEQISEQCLTTRLILHGRDSVKLADLKNELIGSFKESSKTSSRQLIVETINYDFSDPHKYETSLIRAIEDVRPDSFVNCAGISYPSALYFHELPVEFIDKMITINLITPLVTACSVVKTRKSHSRNNQLGGSIVMLGSASSLVAEPLLSLYSATKAALNAFGYGLASELYGTNLAVQVQVPLMITSKLSKIRVPSFFVPSACQYSKAALKSASHASNRGILNSMKILTSPYIPHFLALSILSVMPKFLLERLRLSEQKVTRSRYLKKTGGLINC